MNARDFFELVAQMRTAQQDYHRVRTHEYLSEAISLEKKVDDEIRRVENILRQKEEK